MIIRILKKTIDFLVDVVDRMGGYKTVCTLADVMNDVGLIECPWCEGEGLLTKYGLALRENKILNILNKGFGGSKIFGGVKKYVEN